MRSNVEPLFVCSDWMQPIYSVCHVSAIVGRLHNATVDLLATHLIWALSALHHLSVCFNDIGQHKDFPNVFWFTVPVHRIFIFCFPNWEIVVVIYEFCLMFLVFLCWWLAYFKVKEVSMCCWFSFSLKLKTHKHTLLYCLPIGSCQVAALQVSRCRQNAFSNWVFGQKCKDMLYWKELIGEPEHSASYFWSRSH